MPDDARSLPPPPVPWPQPEVAGAATPATPSTPATASTPSTPSTPNTATTPSAAAPNEPLTADESAPVAEAASTRLVGRWRFIAAFGWAVILAAGSRLAVTARHLEHAPAWLPIWWLLALFPLLTVLAAALDSRWLPWASLPATGAIAFASGWDLTSGRSGLGRYEASLTFSGVVLTTLIWAMRTRRSATRRG